MITLLLEMLHGDVTKLCQTVKQQLEICWRRIEEGNKKSELNVRFEKEEILMFFDSCYYTTVYSYILEYALRFTIKTPELTDDVLLFKGLKIAKNCLEDESQKNRILGDVDKLVKQMSANDWQYPYLELINYGLQNDINPVSVIFLFASMEKDQGIIELINSKN